MVSPPLPLTLYLNVQGIIVAQRNCDLSLFIQVELELRIPYVVSLDLNVATLV